MMRITIAFLLLFFSTYMNAQRSFIWNNETKNLQKKNIEDSLKWDLNLLQMDLKKSATTKEKLGVFPYPRYDLVGKGSFTGIGYGGKFSGIILNNKQFVYNFFYSNKSIVNENYIGDLKRDVFFVIILLTDTIDNVNYSHMNSSITSRNHPNYLARGQFKTRFCKIEYSAFITGDRQSYAIVNDRLYDLQLGKLILLIPQKNNILISRQIDIPLLSKEELDNYIKTLLNEDKVVKLYNNAI